MKTKKKNKKKNKNEIKSGYLKKFIIITLVVLLLVATYFFLTLPDNKTSLTVLEKQWIVRNKKTLIDINVPNNLAILGENGEGVIFDYIKGIEKETKLNFNKVSYNFKESNNPTGLSVLALSNKDKLNEKDVLITEDNYILISKKEGYSSNLEELYNKKIGLLKSDNEIVSNYLGKSYTYVSETSKEDLISKIKTGKLDYAIVPRYYVLKDIVENSIYVNHSFDNISNKIVLRLTNNNRLSSIMKKYLESFKQKDYISSYEKQFMNFYIQSTEATDVDKSSLSSKVYTYGYVKDTSYNVLNHDKLYGFAGEYINLLSNMADVTFKYKSYKTSDKLKAAIDNNEVDIAFLDFNYQNKNGLYTINSFNPRMVAISKTNYRISEKEGLENRKLYTVANTYLEKYLKETYKTETTSVKSINKKIPEDGVLVLDEIDYYNSKNSKKFADYYVLLKDDYVGEYKYFTKNDEKVMYDFLNFILMYTDNSDIKINSINNLNNDSNSKAGFANLYLTIVLIVLIPVLILFVLVIITKNTKNLKLLRKEDVLKYSDMLTSLKNRNYLMAHIDEWDEMKITPRTIIIADLNKLKYINDNYGQEEGNMLIKKAAAILINTQLEKSEIVRTDGNEFLIYLIGYNKTQVSTYINKLSREFEKLPHGFGAAIGYSMIEDEIKTIDDAINEASIEMRLDKEQNFK